MCEPMETHKHSDTNTHTLGQPLFSFSVLGFYYPAFATLKLLILSINL